MQAAPLCRTHQEPKSDAKHEGEQAIGLQQSNPVDKEQDDRVTTRFSDRLREVLQRRKRDELDVDDNDPEQRDEPQIVGHQRAARHPRHSDASWRGMAKSST